MGHKPNPAPVVCRAEAVDDVGLRPNPGAHLR